ncbi:MAG TPA: FAD-dependent oxidoreductase [Solirubrobacteraceae bacterium]|nr:FAD-dependent oxidoreductase [Solirubrobacteraceae bacterium]
MTATSPHGGIVIVGGGLAGQRCAETLRREGCERPIRLICAEAMRPYDRPPLSKRLLVDRSRDETLTYRPERWYQDHDVDLLVGVRATGLAPGEHRVRLSDGSTLRYERLLIGTGARPRTLALLDRYDNVSTLRTFDDARRLREVFATGAALAVIGAGFVGLELAATARGQGLPVTLVEAARYPLAGVLGEQLGGWFADLHEREGATVRSAVTVDAVEGDGSIRTLRLSDGSLVEADHVVVAAGVQPDVEWLRDSGLHSAGGVPVDARGATAAADVYAAGDAAATLDRGTGRRIAGAHWEAAARQGTEAALAMLGLDSRPATPASFWTDQYGLRIQYVGEARGADRIVFDGDRERRCFTATFLRAGQAVAVLLVNRPRLLPVARQTIQKGLS